MDPIRKRKKELQNERPTEFAPPTFYYNKKSKEEQSDVFPTNSTPQTETQSDSNSTSHVPSFSFPPPFMFYPPPIYPYPTPFMYPPPPPSQVPPPSSSITPNSSS